MYGLDSLTLQDKHIKRIDAYHTMIRTVYIMWYLARPLKTAFNVRKVDVEDVKSQAGCDLNVIFQMPEPKTRAGASWDVPPSTRSYLIPKTCSNGDVNEQKHSAHCISKIAPKAYKTSNLRQSIM